MTELIAEGSDVYLYLDRRRTYLVRVEPEKSFHTHKGYIQLGDLIGKGILMEMPGNKVTMRPAILAEYDPYLAKVTQFRVSELSRVHKNPMMRAIKS